MLRNYILIAWRNLLKNEIFSLINIVGLAIGMLVSLLIFIYISFERSYDRHFPDDDRIYRLVNLRYYETRTDESTGCVVALGPALKESFPEVEQFARCFKTSGVFSYDKKIFKEEDIFYADSTFFDIFKFNFLSKVSTVPLSKANMAVISESFALKYFGQENPLHKTILLYGQVPFVIEGVIKDIPSNTHFRFDIVLSFITLLNREDYCFGCNNRTTYVRLAKSTDIALLESKFPLVINKIHEVDGLRREYKLQALTDIHLHSKLRFELGKNGDVRQVKILTIIALLVLLIAWLNYINLSTSLLLNRTREVGQRKVLGSSKLKLTEQFIIESVLLYLIVIVIDLTLLQLVSPVLKRQFSIDIYLFVIKNFKFWAFTFLIYFTGALLSGIISAQILTSMNTLSVLKGNIRLRTSRLPLRKVYVFLQFAVSILLINATIVIYKQNYYLINHELGIDIESVVAIPAPGIMKPGENYRVHMESLINEWKRNPEIRDISFCSTIPGYESGDVGGGFSVINTDLLQLYNYDVALNYFDFFKIPLICGKLPVNYDQTNCVPACLKETELIINRTAAVALGFNSPDSSLGRYLLNDGEPCGTIVAVVEDYNQQSLDKNVNPAYFRCSNRINFLVIRISGNNIENTVQSINTEFANFFPDNPVEFFFLEDYFNLQYKDDKVFANLFGLFSLLAVIITCLGLLGMVLFDSKRRTKEIGIRKVNGAGTLVLIKMLIRENLIILLLASIIAVPVSRIFVQHWLNKFAYQAKIGLWLSICAVILVLVVTIITTMGHVIKTARANPVDSLKYE